jgi:diguanylate cyclase (GGDEF)-like protein
MKEAECCLMKFTAKYLLYLGFALTGILVIVSAGVARLAHVQEEKIQQDIKQTHRLVKDLNDLEITSLEVTMLMRAFVISGDSSSLSQLPAMRQDEFYLQSGIEEEVKGDSGLTYHSRQYLNYVDQRREFVDKVIDARIRRGFSAAQTMEATSEDDRLFDLMQREIMSMQNLAVTRLDAQEVLNQKLQKRVARYETFNLLITLALLIAMGIKLTAVTVENTHLYADLVHRSEFDLLTDIPNRRQLEEQLRALIGKASLDGSIFALIFIDLDRFKQVNDNYGHGVGDSFLQLAAQRMKQQLRPGDMLARLGGDEFAILLASVPDRGQTVEIVHRLERCFDSPFNIGGLQIQGSASMGIAMYPDDGHDSETLLRASDIAMYSVKQSHKERFLSRRDQMSGASQLKLQEWF